MQNTTEVILNTREGFKVFTPEEIEADNKEALDNIPGLTYYPNALTEEEERRWWNKILPFVQERDHPTHRKRVAATGKGFFTPLRMKVHQLAGYLPERCSINFFEPGDPLTPHIDSMIASEDTISVISLGCGGTVVWRNYFDRSKVYRLHVAPRSLYIFANEARYDYLHSLYQPVETQRMSLVFNYGGSAHSKMYGDSELEHNFQEQAQKSKEYLGLEFLDVWELTNFATIHFIEFFPEFFELRRAKVHTMEEAKMLLNGMKPILDLFRAHGGADKTPKDKFLEIWTPFVNDPTYFFPGKRPYDLKGPTEEEMNCTL